MNEYHVDYGKYYDKYSLLFFSSTIRKQNRNLELKTQVEIGRIEKEQKVWLKDHKFEKLQMQRDMHRFKAKLEKPIETRDDCSPSVRNFTTYTSGDKGNTTNARTRRCSNTRTRRCFSAQNDYYTTPRSTTQHTPNTPPSHPTVTPRHQESDFGGKSLNLTTFPAIRQSTTSSRYRRHSTPAPPTVQSPRRTNQPTADDATDVFEYEEPVELQLQSPLQNAAQRKKLLKHRTRTVSVDTF